MTIKTTIGNSSFGYTTVEGIATPKPWTAPARHRQIWKSIRSQLKGLAAGSHILTGSTASGDQEPVRVEIR